MRLLRGALAVALCYALGVHPAVAQVEAVRLAAEPASASAAAGAAALGVEAPSALSLTSLNAAPALSAAPAPALEAAPSVAAPAAVPVPAPAAAAAPAELPASTRSGTRAAARPVRASAAGLARLRTRTDRAVSELPRAEGDGARAAADAQFAALLGERLAAPAASDEPGAPSVRAGAKAPRLENPSALAKGGENAGPPAPKLGLFRVFRDPERNKSFWRYATGYSVFLLGFEMYVVGLPYLISSMTTNALKEHHDRRMGSAEAVKELIRSNRSLARIAHWGAQLFSYAMIPLFTRGQGKAGPRKWLVRSMLIRAAVLAAIPGLFFATGVLSLHAAMWILFGLIAAQSFFQGISVTTQGAATTRMLGDASVTTAERTKANSILTIIGSAIAIVGPLVAGQIALIGPVLGKSGVGGAVIYGIYAGAVAIAGLIFATIKMFGGSSSADKAAASSGDASAAPAKRGLGGTLKSLWTSIKTGSRLVLKDRLLRTLLLMSLVSSLFSDPLVFNVLPEYIGRLAAHGGALGALMSVPGLGWFLTAMTATPMGNFALMVVMASVGSIVATLLMKPATKLVEKFGFKSDAAKTVPFYFLAALQAPLFLLMIHAPTLLGAVALYGLQALFGGFIGLTISGLYQKNLAAHKSGDVNKILAADSLVGIVAAIASTFVYGFILKDIAIGTSLLIAAVATCAMGVLRLAAPFLAFTKAERRGTAPAPSSRPGPPPPANAKPLNGEHNGPNSIHSTHL